MSAHGKAPSPRGSLATVFCVAIFCLLASVTASAQAETGPEAQRAPDAGLIFNMSNILQGFETYQGGMGAKFGFGQNAIRAQLGGTYSSATGAFALSVGVTYEYHLLSGPISPYLGASFSGGYTQEGASVSVVPLSAGLLVGVEVFPVEFLSFFLEYAVAFDLSIISSPPGSSPLVSYVVGTRMGNDAKLGIVFYWTRAGRKN